MNLRPQALIPVVGVVARSAAGSGVTTTTGVTTTGAAGTDTGIATENARTGTRGVRRGVRKEVRPPRVVEIKEIQFFLDLVRLTG